MDLQLCWDDTSLLCSPAEKFRPDLALDTSCAAVRLFKGRHGCYSLNLTHHITSDFHPEELQTWWRRSLVTLVYSGWKPKANIVSFIWVCQTQSVSLEAASNAQVSTWPIAERQIFPLVSNLKTLNSEASDVLTATSYFWNRAFDLSCTASRNKTQWYLQAFLLPFALLCSRYASWTWA